MEPFLNEGAFWHPSDPSHKVNGLLTFEMEGEATLKLHGHLPALTVNMESGFPELDNEILYGTVRGLGRVTVGSLIPRVWSLMPVEVPSYEMLAGIIVKGEHIQSLDNEKFVGFAVRFMNLESWYESRQIRINWPIAKSGAHVEAVFDERPLYTVDLEDAELLLKGSPSYKRESSEAIRLSEEVHLSIYPAKPQSIPKFLDCHYSWLWTFFTLAFDQIAIPISIKAIRGIPPSSLCQASYARTSYRDVEIFLPQRSTTKHAHHRSTRDMLFTFEMVESKLDVYLKNLFARADEYAPAFNFYREYFYDEGIISYRRYLDAVSTAEALHRRNFPTNPEFRKVIRQKVCDILKVVPAQHRQWLKEELNFSHEPSLRERLAELSLQLIRDGQMPCDVVKNAIGNIVKTRNAMTHHDPRHKKWYPDTEKFASELRFVKWLNSVAVMALLGFQPELVGAILKRSQEYLFMRACLIKSHGTNPSSRP